MFISAWIVLFSSAERTAAVKYPLNVAQIFSRKRCIYMIMAVFCIFLSVTSSFQLMCFEFSEAKHHCQIYGGINGTCFKVHTYYVLYRSTISTWLPIVIGTCLNSTIVVLIYRAHNKRQQMTVENNQRSGSYDSSVNTSQLLICNNGLKHGDKKRREDQKELQITIMLLMISISFIVLTLPYSLFELLRKLKLIQDDSKIFPRK